MFTNHLEYWMQTHNKSVQALFEASTLQKRQVEASLAQAFSDLKEGVLRRETLAGDIPLSCKACETCLIGTAF